MTRGRGRLNSIQLLPRECSPIVQWAAAELQETQRTQLDIYQEFVTQLQALQRDSHGELEFTIPSIKSFNRYSIGLDAMAREINEMREMTRAVVGSFDAAERDDTTLVAVETIKGAIVNMLRTRRGKIDEKGLQALANGLKAILQAQGISQSTRQKVEAELRNKVGQAVAIAEKANAEKPDGLAVIKKIREEIYGIFDE